MSETCGKSASEVISDEMGDRRFSVPIMDALNEAGFTIVTKDWAEKHANYGYWLHLVREGRCYACAQFPEIGCRKLGPDCPKGKVTREQMVDMCPYDHHLDRGQRT